MENLILKGIAFRRGDGLIKLEEKSAFSVYKSINNFSTVISTSFSVLSTGYLQVVYNALIMDTAGVTAIFLQWFKFI